jgi:hypothetical protein
VSCVKWTWEGSALIVPEVLNMLLRRWNKRLKSISETRQVHCLPFARISPLPTARCPVSSSSGMCLALPSTWSAGPQGVLAVDAVRGARFLVTSA